MSQRLERPRVLRRTHRHSIPRVVVRRIHALVRPSAPVGLVGPVPCARDGRFFGRLVQQIPASCGLGPKRAAPAGRGSCQRIRRRGRRRRTYARTRTIPAIRRARLLPIELQFQRLDALLARLAASSLCTRRVAGGHPRTRKTMSWPGPGHAPATTRLHAGPAPWRWILPAPVGGRRPCVPGR